MSKPRRHRNKLEELFSVLPAAVALVGDPQLLHREGTNELTLYFY